MFLSIQARLATPVELLKTFEVKEINCTNSATRAHRRDSATSKSQLKVEMSSNRIPKKNVIILYRQIIRSAKVFPSKNRGRILTSIRDDFKINKNLEDGEKLTEALSIAVKGLSQLNMYSNLDPTRGADWSVTLDSSPMPDNK